MNYLAHLFLAGKDEGLIIGNFIADSVRGKEINNYSENIQRGIRLHRKIDAFTDNHPIVKLTTSRLRRSSAKYAPVVTDIVYDHFLAANWDKYSQITLNTFAIESYRILHNNLHNMPVKIHELYLTMEEQNWLVNYSSIKGITQTLTELSAKVKFANTMATAIIDLEKEYDLFKEDFLTFFPFVQEYVKLEMKNPSL